MKSQLFYEKNITVKRFPFFVYFCLFFTMNSISTVAITYNVITYQLLILFIGEKLL